MFRRVPLVSTVIVLVIAGSLSACSVPVFRYALEHWRPDAYVAVVFHRGALNEDQQALLAALQPLGQDDLPGANLVVQTVDLDGKPDDAMVSLWEEQETEALPWLVVNSPLRSGPPTEIWAGELTDEHQSAVIDSPARQQISKRLLSGDSVVWVCLDSGDAAADETAFEFVRTEVDRLQEELELPEIEEADLDDLSLDPEALKLKMSTIRVSRDDVAEAFLVDSLLHVEPDLLDEPFVHQPMAFPVFGRGRALYALVGDGITAVTVEEACQFLTGACQCTVKAQNPGVDLLMAIDWDRHIQLTLPADDTQPELAGLTSFANIEPQTDGSDVVSSAGDSDRRESDRRESDRRETEAAGQQPIVAGEAHDDSAPTAQVTSEQSPVALPETVPTASSSHLTRNVFLVVGLLATCVIAATIVLIPRSR